MKIAAAVMVSTLSTNTVPLIFRLLNAAVIPPRNSATLKSTVRRR